jgi:hypothetical protein
MVFILWFDLFPGAILPLQVGADLGLVEPYGL